MRPYYLVFHTSLLLLLLLSFFLLLRLPPRSTLFPYTTLFRSPGGGQRSDGRLRADRGGLGLVRHREPRLGLAVRDRDRHGQDRKSTRLNSSHLGISYAVFCLKKKKKRMTNDRVR